MKKSILLRIYTVLTVLLVQSSPAIAHATHAFSTAPTDQPALANLEPSNQPEAASPFAHWGLLTPPGAEDYKVNQAEDRDLAPQGLQEWHPTSNPRNKIIPGRMRSDQEFIPAGLSKEDADQAELMESQLAQSNTASFFARPDCSVFWPAPFEVCGEIKDLYTKLGGPTSFLLFPKSNELTSPDGIGKRSEFINGFIYWHPETGAHSVSIPVSKVWQRHGWEGGFLGYPTTDDISLGNQWYVQHFQGGHVYTHNALPATQASIQGAIYEKWQSMGAQNSELGFPISDELTTSDGIGRYSVFEHGMIYWTPRTGAHYISGGVLNEWSMDGFEQGPLGYPVSDPTPDGDWKVKQQFEHGTLSGYISIIAELGRLLELNSTELHNTVELLLHDFSQHGLEPQAEFAALVQRAQESLLFTKTQLSEALSRSPRARSANEAAGCVYESPGSDETIPGDVFYSVATTYTFNHGHNGIFVSTGATDSDIETVEAVNPEKGVQRLHASERLGVCGPTLLRVDTDDSTREKAVTFAEKQVGKQYNKNFATTRIGPLERDSYNCSQLIWAAYKYASDGGLDIGERFPYQPYSAAVFPGDIMKSHNTFEY